MRLASRILFLFSVSALISGCVPVMVGGGMVGGGYVALREKGVGDSLSDVKIETVIKSRLYKISPKLYSAISVNVDRGCVLLTGAVLNTEWISAAEKEAWSVEGVVVVDNNISSGEIPISQTLKDALITSSCRTSLLCSKDVRSVNYKLKTMNGIVYVTGVARSEEELNKTLEILQKAGSVKKVVSYVNVIKRS